MDITDLGHDVFQIDTQMAGYQGITAGYLIRSDRPCLVETGTAPSAPVVRDALTALGVGAGDLATVVVTHIHLDHAGGAGDIAAMYPAASIVVHERGARHLADPSRLMASARMVYGTALDRLFGVLAPVPSARIVALEDTGTVDLGGGRRLDSHYSPGHAKHHVGLIDSMSGDLYVGDAAGVYIPETGDLRPATPPPDFLKDSVGWENVAHEVESIYGYLPASERNGTIIISAYYGVPGALRIYGDNKTLPVAVSPQLSDWYWLPRNLVAKNALMIDYQPSDVAWMCSSATLVGHLTVPYGVQGLEQGAPVTFCVLRVAVTQAWSQLRIFS